MDDVTPTVNVDGVDLPRSHAAKHLADEATLEAHVVAMLQHRGEAAVERIAAIVEGAVGWWRHHQAAADAAATQHAQEAQQPPT